MKNSASHYKSGFDSLEVSNDIFYTEFLRSVRRYFDSFCYN